jgi:hypothetical protein
MRDYRPCARSAVGVARGCAERNWLANACLVATWKLIDPNV